MALGSVFRRVAGWPARRLLDRRVQWILNSFDEHLVRVEERLERLETEMRLVGDALAESGLGRQLARLTEDQNLVLPETTARFLKWAEGHEGPAARAGLWFNPPVGLDYGEDRVAVRIVNERIVEQPYVFGALGALPRASRILDLGGAESTVALSLASVGHEVHVVDPRGYPLEHPMLRQHALPLDELRDELRFDAAVALSSIEHFGIGAYGQAQRDEVRLDRLALGDVRARLVPGGVLVLTVPCGAESEVDQFQRTYSLEELREMLSDWEIADLSFTRQLDPRTWISDGSGDPIASRSVALVTAKKPA